MRAACRVRDSWPEGSTVLGQVLKEDVDFAVRPCGEACHDCRGGRVLMPSVARLRHEPLECLW
eukprot:5809456-Alexandrium_andersonii.AAC.1